MSYVRVALSTLVACFLAACAATPPGPSADALQALAPTGKLRVALLELQAHAVKDPYTGNLKGVSHDLTRELAARLGVPFEPVFYPNPGAYIAAGQAGQWDIGSMGVAPERRASFDFPTSHMAVEVGYLAPAGSRLATASDIDRAGVRVAVVERGTPDIFLTASLKQASIVRGSNFGAAVELVKSAKADVLGAQKPNLYQFIDRLPGARILEGRAGIEEQALAVPTGRNPAGVAYVSAFIQEAKATGLVKQALERSGLRGAVVAP